MQPDSSLPRVYVGLKQSTEAVSEGLAKKAFIAADADSHVIMPFVALCKKSGIPVEEVETKAKLGKDEKYEKFQKSAVSSSCLDHRAWCDTFCSSFRAADIRHRTC